MTDHEHARQTGLDDETKVSIGLFTLLRLVADFAGLGKGHVSVHSDSSLLSGLRAADPTHKHWHEVPLSDGKIVTIWRRKEWTESYEKQQREMSEKGAMLEDQARYNEAKEIFMTFTLAMCNGDRRAAERMFAPIANNKPKLYAAAERFKKMKGL